MFASRLTVAVSLGDPVGPVSAIALSRPICEPTNVIWTILEWWAKSCESPLDWSLFGTCNLLDAVSLTTNQDKLHQRCPIHGFAER